MSSPQFDSGPTSNDLLENLVAEHAPAALSYQVVAQSAEAIESVEDAPPVSMAANSIKSR
jgi:hypothetical protein